MITNREWTLTKSDLESLQHERRLLSLFLSLFLSHFFFFFSLTPFAFGLTSVAFFPPANQLGIRDWFKSEIRPSEKRLSDINGWSAYGSLHGTLAAMAFRVLDPGLGTRSPRNGTRNRTGSVVVHVVVSIIAGVVGRGADRR
jgi:hypothetical protein